MSTGDNLDSELPLNTSDRSLHMKDMGCKGLELVSVFSNPVSGVTALAESHISIYTCPERSFA